MLNFIGLMFLGALVWPSNSVILGSRKLSNYGKWHSMEYCPPDMYAVGVQIKFDTDIMDITALNAVALYCDPLNSSFYTNKHQITSGVGSFGTWLDIEYCPQDKVIVGFYLSRNEFTIADDIGAYFFTALCGDPFGTRDPSKWLKDESTPEKEQELRKYICPKGYAVRGIQTQVEEAQGTGDDTALNNVNLDCHEIKFSCTHEFITLFDYSNSGSTPVSRSYTEKIAYTHKSGQTTEKESSERNTMVSKMSIGIGDNLSLSINGEIGNEYEKITTQKLISMFEHTIHHEKEEKVDIQIPPKSHTTIKQLHIICGNYRVGMPKMIRKEYHSSSPRAGFELFSHFYLLFLAYIAFDILSI